SASLLSGLSEGFEVLVNAIEDTRSYHLDNNIEALVFFVDYKIVANYALTRDEFESKVIGTFFNTTIHLDYRLKSSLMVRSYYRFERWRESPIKILENSFFSTLSNMQIYVPDIQFEQAVYITHLLQCPHLRFGKTQYKIIYNKCAPAYNITLKTDINTVQLYINDYIEFSKIEIDENMVLKVCRDLLELKLSYIYQDLSNSEGNKEIPRPQNILTIACMAASITCLCLTLLTYCMFGELRTEAGVNNMFLSSSVLMAQLSLLAAANV
ncbi:adhesion G protein-coupled receptor E3, partial [Biomphalaria glabrata]